MDVKALRLKWSMDQDGTWLHVLVEDGHEARKYAEANADRPQRLTLKRWSEKRSLNANSYAWSLLNKLSGVLKLPSETIYRSLIPDVGDNGTAVSVPIGGLEQLRSSWGYNGKGWVLEVLGISDTPGNVDVMLYSGSSVYDKAQMARLIDLIIDECREAGVEYLPPDKLAAMLEGWDEVKKNKSP